MAEALGCNARTASLARVSRWNASRKMGLIFTHKPELPGGAKLFSKDLVNPFFKTLDLAPSKHRQWLWILLLLLLAVCLLAFWKQGLP